MCFIPHASGSANNDKSCQKRSFALNGAIKHGGVIAVTTQQELDRLAASHVIDAKGEDVGAVSDVYLDDSTGQPEWVTVKSGVMGRREHFVPLVDATWVGENIQVPLDKQQIKDAPHIAAEENLSVEQEEDLYQYYRIPAQRRGEGLRSTSGSAPGTTTGRTTGTTAGTSTGTPMGTTAGTAAGAAAGETRRRPDIAAGRTGRPGATPGETGRPGVTSEEEISTIRSEEHMRVGTERRESGRVHLRKHVVSTPVERTVPVSHEEVRVEREPITGAESLRGEPLAEGEQEVVLHEERPVVETESVPVERVRVRTERVEGEETVRGEVRREEVEIVEDEIDTTARGREKKRGKGPGGKL